MGNKSSGFVNEVSLCFIIFMSRKKGVAITEHFLNSSICGYKELVQQSPLHHKGLCSYFFSCSC